MQSSGSLILFPELDVDVADHVVSEVITDVEALDLTELAEFFKDVFVEVLKVLLDLPRVDGLALGVNARGDHVRALVHVG